MIERIHHRVELAYSGYQDGADIAGVRAAQRRGIPTGGWMPYGCRTASGPRPEYVELYGCHVHPAPGYAARTRRNVEESDATIILGYDHTSAGSRLTIRCCAKYRRPLQWISVRLIGEQGAEIDPRQLAVARAWLDCHRPRVLNIAGNRDPRIEPAVEGFTFELLA